MLSTRFLVATRISQRRLIHSSPSLFNASTTGQAPAGSRKPVEKTNADQNQHLKHSKPGEADKGQGNAAENPTLPSHQTETTSSKSKSQASQSTTRGLHTSARLRNEDSKTAHSADTYSKEVDTNPPRDTKTHHVEGEGQVQRPFEATRPEYANVSQETPFELPVEESEQKDQRLGYSGVKGDSEKNTSDPDEGPDGKNAGGMQGGSPKSV